MKIVFDSNVLIAAFAAPGLCHEIFEEALLEHEIICSAFILSEVRQKLIKKIKMPVPDTDKVIRFLEGNTGIVIPEMIDIPQLRDPDDRMIIATAVTGHADILITGDKDLLVLKTFKKISIQSPRDYISA